MKAALIGEEAHRRLHRARLAYFARRLASASRHERDFLVQEIAFERATLRNIVPRRSSLRKNGTATTEIVRAR